MNKTLAVALIALILSIAGLMFPRAVSTVIEKVGGTTQSFVNQFDAGIVVGGVSATTTAGTVSFPVSLYDQETVVEVLPTSATTLTFSASSTMTAIIPRVGDTKTFFIHNRGTSTSNSITLAAGTGVALKRATSTNTMAGDTDGNSVMRVTLVRLFNNNVSATFDIFAD